MSIRQNQYVNLIGWFGIKDWFKLTAFSGLFYLSLPLMFAIPSIILYFLSLDKRGTVTYDRLYSDCLIRFGRWGDSSLPDMEKMINEGLYEKDILHIFDRRELIDKQENSLKKLRR